MSLPGKIAKGNAHIYNYQIYVVKEKTVLILYLFNFNNNLNLHEPFVQNNYTIINKELK